MRWHIVRDEGGWALCHRLLSALASSRPIIDLTGGRVEADMVCPRCRAVFEHGTRPTGGQNSG
ncbi:hypothetical protein [Streptacidiphilus rugosus]|uniref:hypothetical protein n=1 Tax=Streptacidiphilus rugosus TaxID=405783 RepID=UPI00056A827F|nr:hypothetical protein [Streptacidiphilus rugosus]